MSYKATARSTMEYAAPIWAPHIAPSHWKAMQTLQNHALRTATGNVMTAGIDHLHQETKVMKIKDHSLMISKQYHVNCFLPGHPGHKNIGPYGKHRNLQKTVIQHKDDIYNFLPVLDKKEVRKAQNKIHTQDVKSAIRSYKPNRVLGRQPPKINKREHKLERPARVALSQLRSGFSTRLNSWKHRVNPDTPDQCPDCQESPHDTAHLFSCRANPTPLLPIHLWTRPKLVADFLHLNERIT